MTVKSATRRKSAGPPRSADSQLEQKIADLGLVATLTTGVSLSRFDEKASLHNQARLGEPVDKAHVRTLMDKLEDGWEAPAIVAHEKEPGDLLLIVDGNHRYQAYKRTGLTAIDAYVIKGNDPATRQKVELLMYKQNAEHGKPTTDEERAFQALNLHDKGASLKDAARTLSVPYGKVQSAFALQEAGRRADRMNINRGRFDRLPPTIRKRLQQLPLDEVFAAMAKVTLDAGLSIEDFLAAMKELTDLSSFDKQMAYIDNLRKTFGPQIHLGNMDGEGKGRQVLSARKQLMMTLTRVENLPRPEEVKERLSPEDADDLRNRLKATLETLRAFHDAL